LTVTADKSALRPTDRCAAFASIYDEHLPLLLGLAMERFGIGRADAQTLAHEVFLAYFLKMDDVRDVRAWLVGAICNASKHHLRKRDRDVEVSKDSSKLPIPGCERLQTPCPTRSRRARRCPA